MIEKKLQMPNYVDTKSFIAEETFENMLLSSNSLGVESISPKEFINTKQGYKIIEELFPQRLDLVSNKIGISKLEMESFDEKVFADKVLGIDSFFRFNGKIFGVDVASGKSSTLINKRGKMLEMKDVYQKLGIDYCMVVKIEKDINEDFSLMVFSLVEKAMINPETFFMEFRANKNEEFKEIYFLS